VLAAVIADGVPLRDARLFDLANHPTGGCVRFGWPACRQESQLGFQQSLQHLGGVTPCHCSRRHRTFATITVFDRH